MSRDHPPPGWRTAQSQNLYRPWTCERLAEVTRACETEEDAVEEAWRIHDAGSREEVASLRRRVAVLETERDALRNRFAAFLEPLPEVRAELPEDLLDELGY